MLSNPSLLVADQTDATQAFLTAIKKGNSEEVSLLIEEKNIDLEYRDELGQTPLILATTLQNNAISKILIDAGVNEEKMHLVPVGLDEEDFVKVDTSYMHKIQSSINIDGFSAVFLYMFNWRRIIFNDDQSNSTL